MNHPIALESNSVLIVIEYLGILFAGINGGLVGVHRKLDVFSILVCSWATALGGGFIRDIAMGDIPPVGISDYGFILTAFAGGLIVIFAHLEIDSMNWSLIFTDALATALFAVDGTAKGLTFGFNGGTALFLGMLTAFGGGTVRDLLLNDVPLVIRDKHFYAVPTIIGCVLTIFCMKASMRHWISLGWEIVFDICIVIAVVLVRILSVKFNLTVPGAMPRKRNQIEMTKRFMTTTTKKMIDYSSHWYSRPQSSRSAKRRRRGKDPHKQQQHNQQRRP